MKKDRSFLFVFMVIFGFALAVGCVSQPMQRASEGVGITCIQGKVRYRSPIDSALVPYPAATVSAWITDTDKGIAETTTDNAGNFCIEIPMGNTRVDLRVWGAPRIERTTYLCQGSVGSITLGSTQKKCGEGCREIDINADCRERVPGTRR